jgi:hypothetical protein
LYETAESGSFGSFVSNVTKDQPMCEMTGAIHRKQKTAVEIEKLLHWTYRYELSKQYTSSAEGIWEAIEQIGWLGGISPDRTGSAQRYTLTLVCRTLTRLGSDVRSRICRTSSSTGMPRGKR